MNDSTNTERGLGGVMTRLSNLLANRGGLLAAGEVAALRRMDPRRVAAAGFYKLVGAVLDAELPAGAGREETETRWAAVIVALAHLGELHQPGRPLGAALAAAGYSEQRSDRLLRADADRLLDEVPALGRYLAAKGVPADITAAARLLLSYGRSDEERTRRQLARDYYGSLARAQ